jgi:hypothetical protein
LIQIPNVSTCLQANEGCADFKEWTTIYDQNLRIRLKEAIMGWSKQLAFLLSFIFAICLGGCASDESVTTSQVSVSAAGPPPKAETIPPAPNPNWYWAPGFWQRQGDQYVWTRGHWVEPRPSQVYVNSYWTVENGTQVFHESRWVDVQESSQNVAVITATVPVPPPQPETVPPSPGSDYFWVNGQYHWENGNYAWINGHWERYRPSQVWVPERWVPTVSGEWRLTGGYWQPIN